MILKKVDPNCSRTRKLNFPHPNSLWLPKWCIVWEGFFQTANNAEEGHPLGIQWTRMGLKIVAVVTCLLLKIVNKYTKNTKINVEEAEYEKTWPNSDCHYVKMPEFWV